MKHVEDTQWVNTPTRERLAAARKRTLRSATARSARSVWSECQSRVIESRKLDYRPGFPNRPRGNSTAMHRVRRHRKGTQAKCMRAGPGSESGAKTHGGILGSWESRTDPLHNDRTRTTPVHQRPGARAEFSGADASETRKAAKDSASEGNRSERGNGGGRLSGLIVANESRRTETGGNL
jgi:hypothetical protein